MSELIQTTKDKIGERKDAMKNDMYHARIESIQKAQNEGWYDSNYFESIQSKLESFYDTI